MFTLSSAKPVLLRGRTFSSFVCTRFPWQMRAKQTICSHTEDPEMKDFADYLDSLKNYEKSGVPRGAGTDSCQGFDLGRMRRLMERFGNPQSKFKVRLFSLYCFFNVQCWLFYNLGSKSKGFFVVCCEVDIYSIRFI